MADGVQCAGQRDIIGIVASRTSERTVLAPPRHAAIAQPWIAIKARLGPDTEPLGDAGAKSFDQGIGLIDKSKYHSGTIRMGEVNRDGTPVSPNDVEFGRNWRSQRYLARPIDSQNVSTKVGQ